MTKKAGLLARLGRRYHGWRARANTSKAKLMREGQRVWGLRKYRHHKHAAAFRRGFGKGERRYLALAAKHRKAAR